jgi:BolA family transcriptional regulator, general stress-responsive regulator
VLNPLKKTAIKTMSVTAKAVHAALEKALQPLALTVRDDSHLHAGHQGAKEGRHFHVHVVSSCFEKQTRVQRHRLVYEALATLMNQGIHALAIDAHTP